MDRQSIVFAVLFIAVMSVAKTFFSIGIFGSAIIGAVAGVLGLLVESLIEKIFPKTTKSLEKKEENQ